VQGGKGAIVEAATATAAARGRAARELDDLGLVLRARNGDGRALDALIRRYSGFVRLKASSYFLAGGDSEDLHQEGLVGLYKAVRDYRVDKDTSFRSFAELCITRQIITAIKGATRFKHAPLNGYVSFSHTPAGQDPDGGECTLGDSLAASAVNDPCSRVIASEELEALVDVLGSALSKLESAVLRRFIEGESYDSIAAELSCDAKAVDNALQRVKRKVGTHLAARS
jgi:RNA polymerase sporulation-specific sigma factor